MNSFFTIIKLDYLQRTRSYAFLITLCASLAIAYTFVPQPNANYSTIRISNYIGYYNSSWFGYVTAIMTSIFLSLVGFYLVNSGIKTDIKTKVGQIVATTSIKNFTYLLSKALSNFLILCTIVLVILTMSIVLFFLYNDGYSFEIDQFIKPYTIITIPALFCISILAVIFEVLIGKYSVVQNTIFFFLFSFLLVLSPKTENQFSLDIFGSKIVMHQLEESVREITKDDKEIALNIGYVLGNTKKIKKFEFTGVDFPNSFMLSRFVWMFFGILLLSIISPFFHRFNVKEYRSTKKITAAITKNAGSKEINVSSLPSLRINYRLFPLLKTELLLLFRKGKKWLWFLNMAGMILLAVLPLKIAHQMVLPILWFFQVSRLSDLTIKETTNNTHYFAFASYKPISRLFVSQLVAGVILMISLALPLVIRLGISFNYTAIISILIGSIFIVLLAVTLGMLSKGKKLFEVLFFMIAYANVNGIVFTDYFGSFQHDSFYIVRLSIFTILLGTIGFLKRKYELKK